MRNIRKLLDIPPPIWYNNLRMNCKLGGDDLPKYMTKQRKALLAFLSEHADEELTAKQLETALSGEGISISAVYRNLSDLEKEGKIRRVSKSGTRRCCTASASPVAKTRRTR